METSPPLEGAPSVLNSLQNLVLEHRLTCNELEALAGDFDAVLKELAARENLRALLEETKSPDSSQPGAPIPALGKDIEVIFRKSREAVARSQTLRSKAKRLRDGIAGRGSQAPKPDGQAAAAKDGHQLSRRERQVLTLMVQGMSSKEIAAALGISFKTAVTHRASIMGKLDVHEIASVVREAILRGLV
jgi:DNA-binding CsgD family transcriptional regulator